MRTELRNPEPAGPPVDWLAEFRDEEEEIDQDTNEKRELTLLADFRARNEPEVRELRPEERLIPLPDAEPPATWNPPPHRVQSPHKGLLSMPALVLVGIAIVAALSGAAVLWKQMVDRANRLSPPPAASTLPALSSIESSSTPRTQSTALPPPHVVAPPPQLTESGVSPRAGSRLPAKSPASAKPQASTTPASARSTKAAPARATASALPPLLQGAIDRKRLASAGESDVTGAAPTPVPTATPTPTPTATPTPTPTSLAIAPPPATSTAAAPVTTLGAPPAARPSTAAAPPPPAPDERAIHTAAIQGVLDRYRAAFNNLSVDGLATVWRSVDTRALSRAFNQLEQQTVEFDSCQIEIARDLADATCRGRTSFVPKIGARTPRVEPRQWSFRLVHVRSGWVIDRVVSR